MLVESESRMAQKRDDRLATEQEAVDDDHLVLRRGQARSEQGSDVSGTSVISALIGRRGYSRSRSFEGRPGPIARILVTGGFGFLGSFLVEELLASGADRIHVVDDLSTSTLQVERFLSDKPADRLTHSLMKVADFCADPRNGPFDEIYHLASVVGPAGILVHAGRIVQYIVSDTYSIIDRAVEWNAQILDVSTSEVYGGGIDGLCSEDTPRIVPSQTTVRLEYAVGKIAAETALINICRIKGLRGVIVRPFNIAGPRQSYRGGFVLARFARQALLGEPLTVFGAGTQVRAFTHVKDMAEGLTRAMRSGRSGEAYNIGNPHNRLTIAELAERVIALAGSKAGIAFVDPRSIFGPLYAEAKDKYPDATKAITELGWRPRYGIDDVIRDSLAFTKDELRREGTLPAE